MNVVKCVVAGLGLLSVSVAQQKQLQPIDMFRLGYFMTMGAEDPVAWLDGEHYLVFDAGEQSRGPSSWSKVVARTSGPFNDFIKNENLMVYCSV